MSSPGEVHNAVEERARPVRLLVQTGPRRVDQDRAEAQLAQDWVRPRPVPGEASAVGRARGLEHSAPVRYAVSFEVGVPDSDQGFVDLDPQDLAEARGQGARVVRVAAVELQQV